MAPRRGGSGSSSSSSSSASCLNCNVPIYTSGTRFRSSYALAEIIIYGLCTIAVFACLILSRHYGCWLRSRSQSKGSFVYPAACIALLLDLLLLIVGLSLVESRVRLTYSYYILYIFQAIFDFLAQILILAVLFRFISEGAATYATSFQKAYKGFTIGVLTILSLLAVASVALYTATVGYLLGTDDDVDFYAENGAVILSYAVIYILSVIAAAGFFGRTFRAYAGQTAYRIMLASALAALFIASIFALAIYAITVQAYYAPNGAPDNALDFYRPASYVLYIFLTLTLLLLALIARKGARSLVVAGGGPTYNGGLEGKAFDNNANGDGSFHSSAYGHPQQQHASQYGPPAGVQTQYQQPQSPVQYGPTAGRPSQYGPAVPSRYNNVPAGQQPAANGH